MFYFGCSSNGFDKFLVCFLGGFVRGVFIIFKFCRILFLKYICKGYVVGLKEM